MATLKPASNIIFSLQDEDVEQNKGTKKIKKRDRKGKENKQMQNDEAESVRFIVLRLLLSGYFEASF